MPTCWGPTSEPEDADAAADEEKQHDGEEGGGDGQRDGALVFQHL